jgi:hypothetical protein
MLPLGSKRYVDFRLAYIESNPVTGRTLADWRTGANRLILLRNTEPCADELELKDYGDGRYTVSYSPSSAGHDYLEIYDNACDIRVADVEDIVPPEFAIGGSAAFALYEDFGGAGALRVTLPSPASYVIQVYQSSDWNRGARSDADALGATPVNADGSWARSISVAAGVYHVVASKPGSRTIIKPYLGVGNG